MNFSHIKLVAFSLSLVAASLAQAKTVYIAPNGDNANDGLSDTAPVKTLADAYAKANAAGDVIQFLDGTYTTANFPEATAVNRNITIQGKARVVGSGPDLGAYEYKAVSGFILIVK